MPPFQRSPTSSPGRRGGDGTGDGAAPFACVESNNTKNEIEAHHSKPLQLDVKTPSASPPPDHPSVSSSSLSSSSSSSSSPPPHQDDYYYVTRNALDNFDGSIHAVLECLSRAGVSQASLNELSTDFTQGNYVHVMQHAHDYATCIYGENNSRGTSHRDDHRSGAQEKSTPDSEQEKDNDIMMQQQKQEQEERAAEASVLCFLLLSSWETLHRYLAMQHRQAHRHYFMLRRCQSSQQHDSLTPGTSTLASTAPFLGHHAPQQPLLSSQKVSSAPAPAVSEQAASRLRGVVANLRARKQQQQQQQKEPTPLGTSSQSHSTAQKRGNASARVGAVMHGCVTQWEVDQALKRKLELAESCCTSQKGLLKAQAWQRRLRIVSEQPK